MCLLIPWKWPYYGRWIVFEIGAQNVSVSIAISPIASIYPFVCSQCMSEQMLSYMKALANERTILKTWLLIRPLGFSLWTVKFLFVRHVQGNSLIQKAIFRQRIVQNCCWLTSFHYHYSHQFILNFSSKFKIILCQMRKYTWFFS